MSLAEEKRRDSQRDHAHLG